MKKCPACDKTFEDNLKFCQSDGTPLIDVVEAPPEDPYKTTVANVSDLPIPALDPFKTMVASPVVPEPPKPDLIEEVASAEEFDPLKTIVASDFPPFKVEEASLPNVDAAPEAPQATPAEAALPEPPPTPFEAASPEPPKFIEPEISAPKFGVVPSADVVETPVQPEKVVEAPASESPASSEVLPVPLDQFPEEPVPLEPVPEEVEESLPKTVDVPSGGLNDLSGVSPYGDIDNAPIPSPFDSSMPPGYQIPSAPLPDYKPEFAEDILADNQGIDLPVASGDQQLEPPGWNPPGAPVSPWGGQQIHGNAPNQPSPAGLKVQNKSMAMASLIVGGGSLLMLVGLIIPFVNLICGGLSFLGAIAAIITGFLGRSRAKRNPNEYGGAGLALGGIITGTLTLLAMIGLVIITAVLVMSPGLIQGF